MPVTAFTAFISTSTASARAGINVFFDFLQGPAREADALYILGDLFEYWAGDDDLHRPAQCTGSRRVEGTRGARRAVYLMHGNRDFLLLEGFAHASNTSYLRIPPKRRYTERPRSCLGDTLCTEDTRYQALRKLRSHWRQHLFLLQPPWLRQANRPDARHERASEAGQSAEIMDVTPTAMAQAFRDSHCTRVIHGHTHRPARHVHIVDGRTCERWVLSDWYHQGQYLRAGPDGCTFVDLT
jgi:UDP-2,3-diacylglucosamine hydrolase